MKDIRLEVSARVYNILLDFICDVGIKTFGIKSRHVDDKHIITIYTNRPGLVIGKHGERFENLKSKIHEDKLDANIDIVLEEIDFFIRDDNEHYTDEEQMKLMNYYMIAHGF